MSKYGERRQSDILRKALKGIGYLTDPKTRPGKVFTYCEEKATNLFGKLAGSDRYLDFAGKMMSRSFGAQSKVIEHREEMLRTMRLPTTSEMDDVRERLRRLGDEVEALSSQLELVLEALEEMKRKDAQKSG